jgi:hypothetical protein
MGRRIKRVVEYYSEDTDVSVITQTKSIFSSSKEIGIDPNARPPDLKDLWTYPEEKRIAPRYNAIFDVAIMRNGISFKTKTLNVSTSGALLGDSIPAQLVNQIFEMIIIFKEIINGQVVQHNFPIMAKALGAPLRTPRIQFVKIDAPVKNHLERCTMKFKRVS